MQKVPLLSERLPMGAWSIAYSHLFFRAYSHDLKLIWSIYVVQQKYAFQVTWLFVIDARFLQFIYYFMHTLLLLWNSICSDEASDRRKMPSEGQHGWKAERNWASKICRHWTAFRWLELLSSWQSLSIYKIAKQMWHKCCQYVTFFDSSVCTVHKVSKKTTL